MRTHFLCGVSLALAMALAPTVLAGNASDDAGDPAYADGWQNGDNGGSGFLPWSLSYSGVPPTFHSDHFIDNAPLAANSLGAPAFGMTDSGRAFFFDTAEAIRPFAMPLAVGQTFEVDVDGAGLSSGDPNPFTKGNVVALRNNVSGGASVNERFGIFTNNTFMNDNWAITAPTGSGSVDTGIPAANSFHLSLTLTGAETYNVALTPIGGGAPLFSQSGILRLSTAGSLIDRVTFSDFGTGSAADGSSEMFLNNLSIIPEPASTVLAAGAIVAFMLIRRKK